MKSCMTCNRIEIGQNYANISLVRMVIGLPFVYLPIIFLPFFLLSAGLIFVHLRFMGAKDLSGLQDFLPDWESHRYKFKTQIVRAGGPKAAPWVRTRLFWFFNCTFYCPFSVAVLEWHSYLVKAVENWWCPFAHSRKENYQAASLDLSYWHAVGEEHLLHPDDRANRIWREPSLPIEGDHGRSKAVDG